MSMTTDSWLDVYENDRIFERRIGTRVDVSGVEVTWRRPSDRGRNDGATALVADLSITGIGLIASPGVECGSTMGLEHAGGRALVDVRWSQPIDDDHTRYGCAFAALDDVFEAWVHQVVVADSTAFS